MKAIDISRVFIGEKEKRGNAGFFNPKLQLIMTEAGHRAGEAWCCYFCEAVFCEAAQQAGHEEREKELRKLFSANCVQTFRNFVKSGKYKVSKTPIAGALVIFQKMKQGLPTSSGHAAIVEDVAPGGDTTHFTTIEGNTNSSGSREGDSVQRKKRSTKPMINGLSVLGFVVIEP